MTSIKILFSMLFSLLLLSACSSSVESEVESYKGNYFDAKLNNARVVKISNKASIQASFPHVNLSAVDWQLDQAVSGNIKLNIESNKHTKSSMGELGGNSYKVMVVPLQPQKNGSSKSSEKINPNSAVLPAGNYIFSITALGSDGWDRKEIFVRVK